MDPVSMLIGFGGGVGAVMGLTWLILRARKRDDPFS
jgi:hypothetical protein